MKKREMRFFFFVFCLLSLFNFTTFAKQAPPPPFGVLSDEEVYAKLKAKLENQANHYITRQVKRLGNKTVQFESFISCEGDYSMIPTIFGAYPEYHNWILNNINVKPGGDSYFIRITDVQTSPEARDILTLSFHFNLPLFKMPMERVFHMKSYSTAKSYTVEAESVPNSKAPIGSLNAYMKVFPAGRDRLWVYLSGQSILKSWLLYEAMPESILNSESGERVGIVVSNYQTEENRRQALGKNKKAHSE